MAYPGPVEEGPEEDEEESVSGGDAEGDAEYPLKPQIHEADYVLHRPAAMEKGLRKIGSPVNIEEG